jgi:hypothetical protein
MKQLVVFFAFLVAFTAARAAGWTAPVSIERVFTEDSDVVVFYTVGAPVYAAGCAANAWTFIGANEQRRARIYATLLTAVASGKKVSFWYQDTCGPWTFHSATAVQIHQ